MNDFHCVTLAVTVTNKLVSIVIALSTPNLLARVGEGIEGDAEIDALNKSNSANGGFTTVAYEPNNDDGHHLGIGEC